MIKTLDELKQEVKLEDLATLYGHATKRKGNTAIRVTPCPVCGDGEDHFSINPQKNLFNSFRECCEAGSPVDFIMAVEKCSLAEAIDKLYKIAGAEKPSFNSTRTTETNAQKKSLPAATDNDNKKSIGNVDFTDYITKTYDKTINNDELKAKLKAFTTKRGISPAQIIENKICIDTSTGYERIVFPVWKDNKVVWYTRRLLTDVEGQARFMDAKGIAKSEAIYNIDLLNEENEEPEPILLVESIIDALNLELLGYKAIAINSSNNLDNFLQCFNTSKARNTSLVAAFDNDSAGVKATQELIKRGHSAINKPHIHTNNKGMDDTDINDWFLDSIKKLSEPPQGDFSSTDIKKSIDAQLTAVNKPNNVLTYLETTFSEDIAKLSAYRDKQTGFDNLDKKMNGLNAGLYVVGGVSSVGKTTFVHQLADQLAERNDHIIYFSLEQSRMEMVSKSLSRTTAKLDYANALSSIEIRKGLNTPNLQNAIKQYSKYAGNVNIVEGNFDTNVDTMREYIGRYVAKNGVNPIVVIDYLQIIPAADLRMGDKQRIDYNVTELKRISRDFMIPLFVISSFNRDSYLKSCSFSSFKESGGIEYTADVVWGLQLGVITSNEFIKADDGQKLVIANKAKSDEYRDIELVCLKNRNGGLFSTKFSYHAKYDTYTSNEGLGDFRKGFKIDNTDEKSKKVLQF